MIPWEDIDRRLSQLGLDRAWLAGASGYSPDSIRTALAPNATGSKRSARIQAQISKAIEGEEAKRQGPREIMPGVFDIFRDEEELDRADRASRLVNAPSLVDFCREVIFLEATRLLESAADETGSEIQPYPVPSPSIVQDLEADPANRAFTERTLADQAAMRADIEAKKKKPCAGNEGRASHAGNINE